MSSQFAVEEVVGANRSPAFFTSSARAAIGRPAVRGAARLIGIAALALFGACQQQNARLTDPRKITYLIVSIPELGDSRSGREVPLNVGQTRKYGVVNGFGTRLPVREWSTFQDQLTYGVQSKIEYVAIDSATGVATCLSTGGADIEALSDENPTSSTHLTCLGPPPTLAVDQVSLDLKIGEQKKITATVTNPVGAALVQWTSSDPSVVSVSPANVSALPTGAATTVSAVKGGTANVTATYLAAAGTLSKTVTVKVAAPTAPTISVSQTTLSLQVGEQKSVTASVANAAGTSPVIWTSKDLSIVTVSPASVAALPAGSPTTFTGVKPGGPVDVVASYTANGTTVTATVAVSVPAAPTGNVVVAMYLDPTIAEYTPSSGNFYQARLLNAQGGEVVATSDGGVIRYASSATDVIQIDSISGLSATARTQVGTKTASITAIYRKNGQTVVTASSPVTVFPSGGTDMGTIQFSGPANSHRIAVGQTIQFQVIVRDQNGIQQTSEAVRGALVVTSSNSSSLTVSPVSSTSFFFNIKAIALPATSALTGIPNVVTIKADINGAMTTIPIIILP